MTTRAIPRKAKDAALAARTEKLTGPDIIQSTTATRGGGTRTILWRVKNPVSVDANGAANDYQAYYTCERVNYDATKFNLGNSDPVAVVASPTDEIVMNLNEAGSTTEPEMIAGDLVRGQVAIDDAGRSIFVGVPVHTGPRIAVTQEAAPTGIDLNVKLANSSAVGVGNAFDAAFFFVDGGTNLNVALPRIAISTYVWVQKMYGVWYVTSPSMIKSRVDCP